MTLLDNLKLVVGDEERILMLNWYHDIVNSVVPDFLLATKQPERNNFEVRERCSMLL